MRKRILKYRYWPLPIAIWSLLVLVSLQWNQKQLEHKVFHLASDRARFVVKMIESARLWNANHGGLYAPITQQTQPNPYLKAPEREVQTPSGVKLTLINPAYMTRQLGVVVEQLAEMQLHLTSLKPLNPINEADAWERAQLEKFEQGKGAVAEAINTDSDFNFRFIAPLRVEPPCLKCHEHQGYRLGDVRGGISVAFSLAPLREAEAQQLQNIRLTHLLVWLLLSVLTLFALVHFRRQMLALEQVQARTEQEVVQRTAELRDEVLERQQAEAQLRLFIDSSGEGIIGLDTEGRCTLVNPRALQLLGLAHADELLGRSLHDAVHHSKADGGEHSQEDCKLYGTLRSGRVVHDDGGAFVRADGSIFPVEYRSHPLRSAGRLLGAVITFSDITTRKVREQTIWRQAHFDALTGLANRKLLDLRLRESLREVAQREEGRLAILYIDLDGFKSVNDSLGHAAGDQLLREAAQRLLGCVRESDTVARIGGDEFVLLITHIHRRTDVEAVAVKVLQSLSQPFVLEKERAVVSASVGIACYSDDGNEAEMLLRKADEAMYQAKQAGRNTYRFYLEEE